MSSTETRFAVLLFSDIVGSTDLKAQRGAVAYLAAAELHNALFERIAAEEKLTLIKNTGDGYLARTESSAAAVRFALRLQQGLRTLQWPAFLLETRVGIHAGEVADIMTLGQNDVLGPAADLAARVMSVALGGQILLSRAPFDEARHFVREHPPIAGRETPRLVWLAHGPYLMKGREEPMELFEVGAEGLAPLVAPPDGEKVRRAIRPDEEETLGWRPAAEIEVPGKPGWLVAEKLGEGGFGEVWLVRQRKTGEKRVFKFCFDPERLRSLKRELSIFRLIRESLGERSDIARLHDVRLDEPPFYLESDFVPSGNLTQWSEGKGGIGKISLDARLTMMCAICRTVAAAHSVGVIHKDIKPSNVLMREDAPGHATPVLADFGIGMVTDASQFEKLGITQAGFTMSLVEGNDSSRTGTRMYAPPESLIGKPPTVQTDVYALGVLLYQLAVGDLQRPLATGWEKGVADPILRADIAAATEGDTEDRLRDVGSLLDRLASQPERRKRMRRAHWMKKAALVLGTAAVVMIVMMLGRGTFQKGKINRLNTQIQQRLESGSLSEKDVGETDRLVAELTRESPDDASEQRRRVADQLASFARTAIHRANLTDADQRQIESWLTLLQPRDAARTAQLRAELAGRLRQWEPAFELKPPFTNAGDTGAQFTKSANEIRFTQSQVPLPVETQGATRVEAHFASLKGARGAIGFAFEDEQKRAYTFRLCPPLPVFRTSYTLDLQSPELAERLHGWSATMPDSASVSLISGKPVLRIERHGNDPQGIEARKYFDVRQSIGKIWTVSWRSRVSGLSEPVKGVVKLDVSYRRKDGSNAGVTRRAFSKNEDWSLKSVSFPIAVDAVTLRIAFEIRDTAAEVDVAELRIIERDAPGETAAGREVFSLVKSEWHPGASETGSWMPDVGGQPIELLSENGWKFLRLANDARGGLSPSFMRRFRVDPSLIKSITISGRMRAPFEIAGKPNGSNLPKAVLSIFDRNGRQLKEQHLALAAHGQWKTLMTGIGSMPADADTIEFGVSVDRTCMGAIDIRDLTCELAPLYGRALAGNENQMRLTISRGDGLLSDSYLPPGALADDSVRISAERVGNSLRVQVGQQRPLEVFDTFPVAAQKFHPVLLTAPGLPLRSLSIYRQRLPEKPQPLEVGDAQFFAGNYAGAMSAYEAQLPTAADATTREQAQLKIGLCLLQEKRTSEAEARFIEAAKAEAAPWSGLAYCQLLALYLGERRVTDADAVLAVLRERRDFADTLGSLTSELRKSIYTGYVNLSRSVLESGDKAEWLMTIERLQNLLEIADALHIGRVDRYWLRFAICRLYAVSGQTERALKYCAEQPDEMENEGISHQYLSGMFCEIYYTLMARGGRHAEALPLLQKWSAFYPNELSAIQTARCLLAMNRIDEAEARLAGVLALHPLTQNTTHISAEWLYAELLKGLIAEKREGPEAGLAVWAAAFRDLREATPNLDPASYIGNGSRPELLSVIMLGGLGGEWKDGDLPSLRKAISETYAHLDTGSDSARQMLYKNAPALFSMQVCLALCRGERGSAYARDFIRGDLLFFETYRMPYVLMVEELFIQGSIGREKLTAEQEALYWKASGIISDSVREKQISTAQALSLLAAWKGVTNIFGWEGTQAQLPPRMRGPVAYIMGQRYVKLGKKEDALGMFRAAKTDAAQLKDAPLAALVDVELRNLKGQ